MVGLEDIEEVDEEDIEEVVEDTDFVVAEDRDSDFEEDIQTVDFSHGNIKKITRLGKCESSHNKIEVFEAIHTSLSDARITLSREIFRFMK